MPRTIKNPEVRKKELLETAMNLFAEEGYDNVSVRSIARAAGVAPGLAYHYFDSKQSLFNAAIDQYSKSCAEEICSIFDDNNLSLDEKIDLAIKASISHDSFQYADFFHDAENGTLHDRLSLGICSAVKPHLQKALEFDAVSKGCSSADASILASMMVNACIDIASSSQEFDASTVSTVKRYLKVLLEEYRNSDS